MLLPSLSLIPSMIAHHASVYLVQLPGSDCGQVGPSPFACPSRLSKLFFQPTSPSLRSLPLFEWLNRTQEAVRYTEAQLAKEERKRPGELSMSITSDYLQSYPEGFEEKVLKRHIASCVYSGRNKRASV